MHSGTHTMRARRSQLILYAYAKWWRLVMSPPPTLRGRKKKQKKEEENCQRKRRRRRVFTFVYLHNISADDCWFLCQRVKRLFVCVKFKSLHFLTHDSILEAGVGCCWCRKESRKVVVAFFFGFLTRDSANFNFLLTRAVFSLSVSGPEISHVGSWERRWMQQAAAVCCCCCCANGKRDKREDCPALHGAALC